MLTDRKRNLKTYIHRGGAETIIQAVELQIRGYKISEVLIDETNGREIARRFDLNVKGTAAVLAWLERDHMIEEKARTLIEKCRNDIGFRISDKVINQALEDYRVE